MGVIEKIFEDIDKTMECGLIDYINGDPVITKKKAKDIICKHMNDGWIPVGERLPENEHSVLLCRARGCIDVGFYIRGVWRTGFSAADIVKDVTAWRPLPEPYKPERRAGFMRRFERRV